MRIDAHHHLWDLQAVHYPWLMETGQPRFFGDPSSIQRNYLLDEFRADAERNGIKASVHIQVGAADAMQEAEWVQSVADNNPDWPLVQVVFCDLSAENVVSQLQAFSKLSSVRGVRQIIGRAPEEDSQSGTRQLLDNAAFLEGLKVTANLGLSFDLQLLPDYMEATAEVLAQVPDLKVALCHAGSPYDRSEDGLKSWAKQLEFLSDLPNVYCKLSGLGMFDHDWTAQSIRPIVDTCIDQFGATRCMFGSNFPVDSLSSNYDKLVQAYEERIAEDLKPQILATTAAEFYCFSTTVAHCSLL
ncbi:MAG: amidohydrolase family protein [Cohaesibacter sp.]|nr:amidohydrolase family protein [Cohaesibacter sp.]